MALKEYKPGTAFTGVIGRTFDVSEPAWPEPLRAKEGAPNVLFIVQDDTGFGQMGCYGSARSRHPISMRWQRMACSLTTCILRRCARRPGRAS